MSTFRSLIVTSRVVLLLLEFFVLPVTEILLIFSSDGKSGLAVRPISSLERLELCSKIEATLLCEVVDRL